MIVLCTFCGESVDDTSAYRRVVGWERKSHVATRRGGSDIVLREASEEFACSACIARLKAGIAIGQESLL